MSRVSGMNAHALYYYPLHPLLFVSACIRMCQNGGTLDEGTCMCDCTDGFIGDTCDCECHHPHQECSFISRGHPYVIKANENYVYYNL